MMRIPYLLLLLCAQTTFSLKIERTLKQNTTEDIYSLSQQSEVLSQDSCFDDQKTLEVEVPDWEVEGLTPIQIVSADYYAAVMEAGGGPLWASGDMPPDPSDMLVGARKDADYTTWETEDGTRNEVWKPSVAYNSKDTTIVEYDTMMVFGLFGVEYDWRLSKFIRKPVEPTMANVLKFVYVARLYGSGDEPAKDCITDKSTWIAGNGYLDIQWRTQKCQSTSNQLLMEVKDSSTAICQGVMRSFAYGVCNTYKGAMAAEYFAHQRPYWEIDAQNISLFELPPTFWKCKSYVTAVTKLCIKYVGLYAAGPEEIGSWAFTMATFNKAVPGGGYMLMEYAQVIWWGVAEMMGVYELYNRQLCPKMYTYVSRNPGAGFYSVMTTKPYIWMCAQHAGRDDEVWHDVACKDFDPNYDFTPEGPGCYQTGKNELDTSTTTTAPWYIDEGFMHQGGMKLSFAYNDDQCFYNTCLLRARGFSMPPIWLGQDTQWGSDPYAGTTTHSWDMTPRGPEYYHWIWSGWFPNYPFQLSAFAGYNDCSVDYLDATTIDLDTGDITCGATTIPKGLQGLAR